MRSQPSDRLVWELYTRLFAFAIKTLHASFDEAEDATGKAIDDAIRVGRYRFEWSAVVVKNALFTSRRDRRRRNENYQLHYTADEPLTSVEERTLDTGSYPADARAALSEVCDAIDMLPARTRDTIRLAAQEYTADEIAETLAMPKTEVYWRLQVARRTLRSMDGYEMVQRKDSAFVGIRRENRKWHASIRIKGKQKWLGSFDSAATAAAAYSAARDSQTRV